MTTNKTVKVEKTKEKEFDVAMTNAFNEVFKIITVYRGILCMRRRRKGCTSNQ